ncbi:hypothetical protein ACLKA6_014649 [Drosophila palustris]
MKSEESGCSAVMLLPLMWQSMHLESQWTTLAKNSGHLLAHQATESSQVNLKELASYAARYEYSYIVVRFA